MGPKPINEITESLMEGTLPFATVWYGVLAGTAVAVKKAKKNKAEKAAAESETVAASSEESEK
jgi:hypothetical protein